MKLWEVKAQSLRIMFTDTELSFNFDEFKNRTVYDNANTREKLIGMNDTIRRAIDLFYQYNGAITRMETLYLNYDEEVGEDEEVIRTYKNVLNTSSITDFGEPTRIDVNANYTRGVLKQENIPFTYDRISKDIYFFDEDFTYYEDGISFTVYYKMKKNNLPEEPDELEYDLDTLYIPGEVQRQIPFYVKAELFEEDEPELASMAKATFLEFLVLNQRKNYTQRRGKVKKTFPWGSE